MKIVIKIIFCYCIILNLYIYSQDSNIVKYFPLKVGNVWVYNGNHSIYTQCSRHSIQRFTVDSQFTINNKVYFKINYSKIYISGNGNCGFTYLNSGYYRVDSLNGNVYKLRTAPDTNCTYNQYDILIDSLYGKVRDTSYPCPRNMYYRKTLIDTSNVEIFGILKPTKYFQSGDFFEYAYFGEYSKDFGLKYFSEYGISMSSQSFLKGCIINGVLYGDTTYTLIGLNQINKQIPIICNLFQNYPNPFNPTTKIKFAISDVSAGQTFLSVYDILGNEISVLVNQNLKPGEYEIEWNATSKPSGVYYYKLQAGEYSETKKMVLLK